MKVSIPAVPHCRAKIPNLGDDIFGSRRMWNENFNRSKFYPKILNQIIKK